MITVNKSDMLRGITQSEAENDHGQKQSFCGRAVADVIILVHKQPSVLECHKFEISHQRVRGQGMTVYMDVVVREVETRVMERVYMAQDQERWVIAHLMYAYDAVMLACSES